MERKGLDWGRNWDGDCHFGGGHDAGSERCVGLQSRAVQPQAVLPGGARCERTCGAGGEFELCWRCWGRSR